MHQLDNILIFHVILQTFSKRKLSNINWGLNVRQKKGVYILWRFWNRKKPDYMYI